MRKTVAFASLIALAGTGCLWERNAADRPARLQMGVNSRRIDTVVPGPPANALNGYAARTTDPPPAPEKGPTVTSSAVTGSMQFTMSTPYHTFLGGQVEAGTLGRVGSNFGAAYAVAGLESSSKLGSLAAEVVGGRRWLRYELGDEDVGENALETRLRGELWLSPQVSFGGMIGANAIPGEHGWMAGVYFGIFSNEYNVWQGR